MFWRGYEVNVTKAGFVLDRKNKEDFPKENTLAVTAKEKAETNQIKWERKERSRYKNSKGEGPETLRVKRPWETNRTERHVGPRFERL